jgi:photosystem II stability/assembly factor-like uncharacterized protein
MVVPPSRPGLWVVALAAVACASAPRPAPAPRAAVATTTGATLRAPRNPCEAPPPPRLVRGWRLVQWPSAPRLVGVDTQGTTLYGVTTSAVCTSVDGGRSWSTVLDDVDWPTVRVEDDRVVVRTGIDLDGRAVSPPTWWISDDEGARWTPHDRAPASPVAQRPAGEAGQRFDAPAVSCGGAMFATVTRGRGSAWLLQSVDGGERWRRVRTVALPQGAVRARCVDSGAVMLERPDRLPVALSRDAGGSWRALRPPPVERPSEGIDSLDEATVARGSGCAPLGARSVFCALYGQSWVSDDDGRHWRAGHSPVGGRAMPARGARLLAVGGAVAESGDAGRSWSLIAPSTGRGTLGLRGGVLDGSVWLMGSALWWSDDDGARWEATLLSFQLVSVLGRRRWVGFDPPRNDADCGGRVRVTTDGGVRWRAPLSAPLRHVRATDEGMEAVGCGDFPRVWVSRDGLRWHRREGPPTPERPEPEAVESRDGVRVIVRDGTLVAEHGATTERIASRWPRELVPVAVSSVGAAVETVLFGNGTVLRRAP